MFMVMVLLEGQSPPQSHVFCSAASSMFTGCPAFSSIHLPINPIHEDEKHSYTTIMCYYGDDM